MRTRGCSDDEPIVVLPTLSLHPYSSEGASSVCHRASQVAGCKWSAHAGKSASVLKLYRDTKYAHVVSLIISMVMYI